ncbi:ATP-binding cassette domain-containing protein [Streptomyces acidicola]|uniref:ATP-binding cassette domain-containing protein n=1 Tax=Streptomyces acidicola TaxID=2596892 RepID=UPI0037F72503
MTADLMIETDRVGRSFRGTAALEEISLEVPRGTVLGLLGHNGAGKTTLVNILTTVLPPSRGTARVAGYDVVGQGRLVRQRIGVTGQFAGVDDKLTGLENLVLLGRLLGAGRRAARARARELIEVFGLSNAADRRARHYSGGMRRRLDLAAGLLGRPDVVFLDEPTTGLDLTSRHALWDIVEGLVKDGTTVLLTTQYLEEADRLADGIVVLSRGCVVATGTAAALKAELGRRTVSVTLPSPHDVPSALAALRRAGLAPEADHARITTDIKGSRQLATVVRALDETDIELVELALHEPTLDDVYLALAREKAPVGASAAPAGPATGMPAGRGTPQ